MFKFVTILSALFACAVAKPGVLSHGGFASSPALAYANAPLYAAGGGTNQIDVRHNYDGTLSSYTTTPFHYSGPYSSRYVAGPHAHLSPAPAPALAAAPFGAHAKYFAGPSGYATSPYAVPHGVHLSSPYSALFSSPYGSYATGAL